MGGTMAMMIFPGNDRVSSKSSCVLEKEKHFKSFWSSFIFFLWWFFCKSPVKFACFLVFDCMLQFKKWESLLCFISHYELKPNLLPEWRFENLRKLENGKKVRSRENRAKLFFHLNQTFYRVSYSFDAVIWFRCQEAAGKFAGFLCCCRMSILFFFSWCMNASPHSIFLIRHDHSKPSYWRLQRQRIGHPHLNPFAAFPNRVWPELVKFPGPGLDPLSADFWRHWIARLQLHRQQVSGWWVTWWISSPLIHTHQPGHWWRRDTSSGASNSDPGTWIRLWGWPYHVPSPGRTFPPDVSDFVSPPHGSHKLVHREKKMGTSENRFVKTNMCLLSDWWQASAWTYPDPWATSCKVNWVSRRKSPRPADLPAEACTGWWPIERAIWNPLQVRRWPVKGTDSIAGSQSLH